MGSHAQLLYISMGMCMLCYAFRNSPGQCRVLRMVLHDIIINSVYIASLYTIFRIDQGTFFILHVLLIYTDTTCTNNNNYQCKNVLEQGPDFCCWFDKTQFSCHCNCVHAIHACKDVFNLNVTSYIHFCQIVRRVCTLVLFIDSAELTHVTFEFKWLVYWAIVMHVKCDHHNKLLCCVDFCHFHYYFLSPACEDLQ